VLIDDILSQTLLRAPKGDFTHTDAQQYLISRYESTFGIFDHTSDTDPYSLQLIAQHPKEVIFDERSPHFERMYQFIHMEIKEHTGMDMIEYLSLPRHMQELMIKAIIKHKESKRAQEDEARRKLDEALEAAKS
jgi:hypothetical protein